MAFRKIKAKKYNGILEYYNPSSKDKETRALYVSYRDEHGTATKKKLDTLDREEALHQLALIKIQVTKNKKQISADEAKLRQSISQRSMTLDQAAKLYFEHRRTKQNHEDKKNYDNRVSPIIGSIKLSKITITDIQNLQDQLFLKYAPKTVNEQINALRALLNSCIKNKWLNKNPVDRSEIPKLEENTEPGRVMSDEELKRMFDVFENGDYDLELAASPTLLLFAKLLYHTGARPAAVVDIQVQHIDFNHNKVHLKAMKKGKSYQQPVKHELLNMLQEWITKHHLKHGDFIFFPQQTYHRTRDDNSKKKPVNYSGIRRAAQTYFDKLFNIGIPVEDKMHRISFYSMRRTSGTKIYRARGIVHAMIFLNHTSVQTTQKYLNVAGDIGDAIEVL